MRTTCNYKRHLQDFQHWLTWVSTFPCCWLLPPPQLADLANTRLGWAGLGWAKDAVNRSLTLLRVWVNILTSLSAKADPIKSYYIVCPLGSLIVLTPLARGQWYSGLLPMTGACFGAFYGHFSHFPYFPYVNKYSFYPCFKVQQCTMMVYSTIHTTLCHITVLCTIFYHIFTAQPRPQRSLLFLHPHFPHTINFNFWADFPQ